jgi:hypothetical protein
MCVVSNDLKRKFDEFQHKPTQVVDDKFVRELLGSMQSVSNTDLYNDTIALIRQECGGVQCGEFFSYLDDTYDAIVVSDGCVEVDRLHFLNRVGRPPRVIAPKWVKLKAVDKLPDGTYSVLNHPRCNYLLTLQGSMDASYDVLKPGYILVATKSMPPKSNGAPWGYWIVGDNAQVRPVQVTWSNYTNGRAKSQHYTNHVTINDNKQVEIHYCLPAYIPTHFGLQGELHGCVFKYMCNRKEQSVVQVRANNVRYDNYDGQHHLRLMA